MLKNILTLVFCLLSLVGFSQVELFEIPVACPSINDTWYVATRGDDSDCQIGKVCKPCRTPWAARDSAAAGEKIFVFAGEWSVGYPGNTGHDIYSAGTDYDSVSLFKDSISYFFAQGAVIRIENFNPFDDSIMVDIPLFFDDQGGTCNVKGFGSFFNTWGRGESVLFNGSGSAENFCCSRMIFLNNDNTKFFIEGQFMHGRDLNIWIDDCFEFVYEFERVQAGWREVFLINSVVSDITKQLDVRIKIIDATVPDTSILLQQAIADGGSVWTNPNYMKPLFSIRPINSNINVQIGGVIMESYRGGLVDFGGNDNYQRNTINFNVDNFKWFSMKEVYADTNDALSPVHGLINLDQRGNIDSIMLNVNVNNYVGSLGFLRWDYRDIHNSNFTINCNNCFVTDTITPAIIIGSPDAQIGATSSTVNITGNYIAGRSVIE